MEQCEEHLRGHEGAKEAWREILTLIHEFEAFLFRKGLPWVSADDKYVTAFNALTGSMQTLSLFPKLATNILGQVKKGLRKANLLDSRSGAVPADWIMDRDLRNGHKQPRLGPSGGQGGSNKAPRRDDGSGGVRGQGGH